jgi:putative zinc finger/helix-turn-helix YgiT family protein
MKMEAKKKLSRCPNCGHSPLEERTITDRFEYSGDEGGPVAIEVPDVPVEFCPQCGETYLGPAAARAQHRAVCQALGMLTPEEIRAIREQFGPTPAEFAQLTGIDESTLSRWESGRLLQNRAMDRYLRLLARSSANVQTLKDIAQEADMARHPSGGRELAGSSPGAPTDLVS